jgi:anti-sigma28 factor (negative regulator of flagellin synthesis)
MRIDPPHPIRSHLHPHDIQEDKGKEAPRKPTTSAGEDKVTLSPDTQNLRRFTALATSEHIETIGIDEERLALVKQRIAAGFYDQPDTVREVADRISSYLR